MRTTRNAYQILVGKPDWKRYLIGPKHISEDNIEMEFGVECPSDLSVCVRIGTSDRLM
jgi:hypothetical protein